MDATAWQRGNIDAGAFANGRARLFMIVCGPIFGLAGANSLSFHSIFWRSIVGVLVGFVVSVLAAFLITAFFALRAPYKQREEARRVIASERIQAAQDQQDLQQEAVDVREQMAENDRALRAVNEAKDVQMKEYQEDVSAALAAELKAARDLAGLHTRIDEPVAHARALEHELLFQRLRLREQFPREMRIVPDSERGSRAQYFLYRWVSEVTRLLTDGQRADVASVLTEIPKQSFQTDEDIQAAFDACISALTPLPELGPRGEVSR